MPSTSSGTHQEMIKRLFTISRFWCWAQKYVFHISDISHL